MKPLKTNIQKDTCAPISSNCVIWQGPDLPCINVCSGDTISDLVYKLAVDVCDLQDTSGLTNLDLSELVKVCSTTAEPAKTLSDILNLLITKTVCLSDIVKTLPTSANTYTEPTLNLTACLQYLSGSGGTVTQLIHSQYTLRIATVLCAYISTTNSTLSSHTSELSSHNTRISNLENAAGEQVVSCLNGGALTDLDVALKNTEDLLCEYQDILGTTSDLNTAFGKQCSGLTGSTKSLSTGSTMSTTYPSWNSSVDTLAKSLSNLWYTVCDIRGAVKIIQDTCCKFDCTSIVLDFGYQWIDSTTIKFFFNGRTSLPDTFYDCNTDDGTEFIFKDGLGNTATKYISIRDVMDDTASTPVRSIEVDLSLDGLDTSTGLTITADPCFTDGTTNCIKCFTKTIAPYINKDCCVITATDDVTVIYKICTTAS